MCCLMEWNQPDMIRPLKAMIFKQLMRAIGYDICQTPIGVKPLQPHQAEAIALIGKHFNLRFLNEIVENGRAAVRPKMAQHPIPEEGLLAIAAYTSAGLDQMIQQSHLPVSGRRDQHQVAKILEALILDTLTRVAPTPASLVKRNVLLNPEQVRSMYSPGAVVQFDRITTVTLQPYQVYRGGNIDLSIMPHIGVIDVSALSVYSKSTKRGEKEGLLQPGGQYEVIRMEGGREVSPLDVPNAPRLHAENWQITLKELPPS